jgi:hypothetical protein
MMVQFGKRRVTAVSALLMASVSPCAAFTTPSLGAGAGTRSMHVVQQRRGTLNMMAHAVSTRRKT